MGAWSDGGLGARWTPATAVAPGSNSGRRRAGDRGRTFALTRKDEKTRAATTHPESSSIVGGTDQHALAAAIKHTVGRAKAQTRVDEAASAAK